MALDNKVNINGKAYGWNDIRITWYGKILRSVTSINYDVTQEKEHVYGTGDEPYAYGVGNRAHTASITLSMDEITMLQDMAFEANGDSDLTKLTGGDIVVTWLNGDRVRVDKIRGAEIRNNPVAVNQNDKSVNVQLDLLPTNGVVLNAQ